MIARERPVMKSWPLAAHRIAGPGPCAAACLDPAELRSMPAPPPPLDLLQERDAGPRRPSG